jgi:hypothetical protein
MFEVIQCKTNLIFYGSYGSYIVTYWNVYNVEIKYGAENNNHSVALQPCIYIPVNVSS